MSRSVAIACVLFVLAVAVVACPTPAGAARERAVPTTVAYVCACDSRPRPVQHQAATPGPPPLTLAAYGQRLARALSDVRLARHATGAARAREISAALALLPSHVTVRAGALQVQADLADVHDDLQAARSDAGRLATAETRLAALITALGAPTARPTAPDARQLRALDDILKGPPFTPAFDPVGAALRFLHDSPLGAIWDAFVRVLTGLLGPTAGGIGNVLPYVAGLVVALMLVFVASRLFGVFVPASETTIPDEAADPLTRVDAATARGRAAELAAAGRYREAARYLFLSTLLTLDEAGRLRIDGATGNRDLLRQARTAPRLAEALTPVVRGFEAFWFGHVPVSREDYERYRLLNERAIEAAQ